MPQVPNEELRAFQEGFNNCRKPIGGGKVAVDTAALRALVRSKPQAAYRFVELHCVLAQGQPGYLQPALMVATAYQVEMNDTCLIEMVRGRAVALGAEDQLARVQAAPSAAGLGEEAPERKAAREWWSQTDRDDAVCDGCSQPIRRGDGYAISGRKVRIGGQVVGLGEELLCQECFMKLAAQRG